MNIWLHMLHPHDFPIKMMMPLALEAQGVLSQCRGRVFHDGASLTDSGKSRPKSQLQWDYHGSIHLMESISCVCQHLH